MVAAHAAGLVALSGWSDEDRDVAKLRNVCEQERIAGFDGKVSNR